MSAHFKHKHACTAPFIDILPQATVNHALSYEQILRQTHISHTTIYVGNLPHYIKEHELAPFFQQFGYVLDIRLQGERGFAFVK